MSNDKELAFVSHDAHPHGSQYLALSIVRGFVHDHGCKLTVLLGGGGALSPKFEEVAPTELVPGKFSDPNAWRNVARRLRQSGAGVVLCNTTVAAQSIEAFRSEELRVVNLIHELPSRIKEYNLEFAARAVAQHADIVVFPSRFVHDRFVAVSGPIEGRVVLRHQGLYRLGFSDGEHPSLRDHMRRRPHESPHFLLTHFCRGASRNRLLTNRFWGWRGNAGDNATA